MKGSSIMENQVSVNSCEQLVQSHWTSEKRGPGSSAQAARAAPTYGQHMQTLRIVERAET